MSKLSGKVVLITGGASGVGAATAAKLVERGAKVVLVDIDEARLREQEQRLGAAATSVVGDVLDLEAMEAAVAHGVKAFGGIDVVMANAGIASYGSIERVDPALFKRVIDINITGVFNTVRAALPQVIERRGYVLVVSSLAAYAAAPGLAPYNASKAGVEHFANALRLELAHRGVKVGSAHMSWIDTPMVQEVKADLSAFNKMLRRLPGPLGKTTSVEACAEAFARGIEKRSRRINVPGWVGLLRWLKPALATKVAEWRIQRDAKALLPQMDEEVARLGRSASARVTAQATEAAGQPEPAGATKADS